MRSNTIHGVIVRANGDAAMVELSRDLDSVRAAIGGGWLEAFTAGVETVPFAWTGYCDEEGKLKGLDRNFVADDLAVQMGWLGRTSGDFLVGDVLFVGGADEEGYDTSMPPEMVRLILDFYRVHGEVVTGAEAERRREKE